jgi:hypothetical protein
MTWEWTVLLSFAIVSVTTAGTIMAIFWQKCGEQSPNIATSIDGIASRLSQLENDHAAITQLAESTKKLLSEASLAKGFRPQR